MSFCFSKPILKADNDKICIIINRPTNICHYAIYAFGDINHETYGIATDRGLRNSCSQHEYLLIYSFKLKSAFDAGSLLLMPVSFIAICCVVVRRYPDLII